MSTTLKELGAIKLLFTFSDNTQDDHTFPAFGHWHYVSTFYTPEFGILFNDGWGNAIDPPFASLKLDPEMPEASASFDIYISERNLVSKLNLRFQVNKEYDPIFPSSKCPHLTGDLQDHSYYRDNHAQRQKRGP